MEAGGSSFEHRSGLVGGVVNVVSDEGVITEFCMKVLKFEIKNSRNLFNYSSKDYLGQFQEQLNSLTMLCFFSAVKKMSFKMARFKIDRTTLDLQVNITDCRVLVGPFPPDI